MRRTALLLAALAVSVVLPHAGALVDPGTGTTYVTTKVTVPMTFPVAGAVSLTDTYLACRSGCTRKHLGQDLMGRKMTPLLAAFDGVVTTLQRDGSSGNYVGITADRGPARGWTALYVHVNNDTPGTDDGRGTASWAFPGGIERGARVLAGQLVGWLGDSGNAESTAPHLHFELRQGTGWSGVVHNPYPSLLAARRLSTPLPSGPHPSGTLLKHPTGALFVLDGARKRPATPAVLAANGRSTAAAVAMTRAESVGYPNLPALPVRDGAVVRDSSGTTWLVHGGHRSRAGAVALRALHLQDPRVFPVAAADLTALPEAPLPTGPLYPGALVRVDGSSAVHRVGAHGLLQPVSGPAMASHGWTWRDVALLPAGTSLPPSAGAAWPLRDGTLVQTPTGRLAVLSGGYARRLRDSRMVTSYGYSGRPRQPVTDALLASYPVRALTA